MRLRWDERAVADLEATYSYVAADNPKAAKRIVDRIRKSVGRLETMPLSGRPGVKKGTRLLVVPQIPYIVIHRVRGDAADIVAVAHAARRRRS